MGGNAIQDRAKDGLPAAQRIGVVGAGIAGLTAAHLLQSQGHRVRVFEKSRGVGGRTTVRRHGAFEFDHGAQYFTVRDPRFRQFVDCWVESGVVAKWQGRITAIGESARTPDPSTTRLVGIPGMNAIAKHLAIGLDLASQQRISGLARIAAGWRLTSEAGEDLGTFHTIVIALPATQAAELLATADKSDVRMRGCQLAPCWAVLLGFETVVDLPFDGAFVNDSPLSWIARNNSKPGRPEGESWILHASSAWSSAHIERSSEEVIAALSSEFGRLAGLESISPIHRDAHRWRYALPAESLDVGCIANEEERWVVCGDWCHGGRIEGAFLSGIAAVDQLMGRPDAAAPATRAKSS